MLNTLISLVALIAAAISSGMTLYLAWLDKTASATLTAGFAVMLLLLTNMSRIEFFKGWGIETRIREQAERAEVILGEAKSIAEIFSRQAYIWMTHIGRLSAPTWGDRFAVSVDIEKMLKTTKSNDISVVEARARLERTFALDAAYIYFNFRNDRLRKAGDMSTSHDESFSSNINPENYQSVLVSNIPRHILSADDVSKLELFIAKSFASIQKTIETRSVDPYLSGAIDGEQDKRLAIYISIFGENPDAYI